MESLSELKAQMNKQRVNIAALKIGEFQKILNLRIEDTVYGKAIKIETEKNFITTRCSIDLLSPLSAKRLKTLKGFFKIDNYSLEWTGDDIELIKKLNFQKTLIKLVDVDPEKCHTVDKIKQVKTKYGYSLLIETVDFKLYKNLLNPITDKEIGMLVGEKFKVNNGVFQWL